MPISFPTRSAELRFRAPLDAAGLLRFLAVRATPGVEEVAGSTYCRTLRLGGGAATSIAVRVEPGRVLYDGPAEAIPLVRRLLDLDADPVAIDAVLAADPALAALVTASPGRRLPGTADPFELAVRAVLGQQVSVAAARRLAGRIVESCGPTVPGPPGRLFPAPQELLGAPPGAFAMPAARHDALRALARAALEDPRWLESERLLALPGIGPWTAAYVAMRAGGDRDAFPPGDVAVRAGLRALGLPDDAAAVRARSDRWRPYRAHATLHLWDGPHVRRPSGVASP